MTETLIKVDLSQSPYENDMIHNRWHPDVPMVATVKPGDDFILQTYDWTGGFIKNDESAADVRDIDLTTVHFLSGPIAVEGAEPGDLLVVDILDIGTLPGNEWGFNGFFSKNNGGGFLTDYFPQAQKSIWDIKGMFTSSRHIPGVRFAGLVHPGLIGCLPDPSLLATWNKREVDFIATNPTRIPPLANAPFAGTAHMGRLKGEARDAAAATGARTVPPREHGGNCDIKDLSRGARVYFPVYVKGAGLSVGDLHFSQGDGEITFCGAIEMPGWIHLGIHSLIKGGVAKYGIKNPIFKPSPIKPDYNDFLIFEGISVDDQGGQHYLDVFVAYQQACLNAINYLKKFGYSGAQAYAILGTAPVHGHISGVVDIPNACATLYLPTEIFDFDINPSADGPVPRDMAGSDVLLAPDL
ncbi:MAG: formamidase [Acidiphilium sp. 37-64-53]|jgi:formamidase|uniref:formamidase n=1 Tax=Acidiphilium TaxID=522 RepID=UPI000BD00C35|nr:MULTISPECIES: formamidase [Acidiphilium]OYW03568.1 MAG: formamidase [Acidiphilium sp. 37-64-53]OZB29491.1 MAG: formamidase [Acidiphilium sp. 34-64-41]HQT84218.1 acetamidase/formamidase family protein [Acidiphilium rubrum]